MSTFPQFVDVLIESLEGHESDSEIDPGGHTVYGFSKATRERLGLPDDMTREQAEDAYRREWWQRYGCDEMPPVVAWLVCDAFVNHLPSSAAKIVQRTLGTVRVDGKFGPKSRAACETVEDTKRFLSSYAWHRSGHYARRSGVLIVRYANDAKKLKKAINQEHGWQSRLHKLGEGMWEAGILRRAPGPVERPAKMATAATAAGVVAAVATGAPAAVDTVAPGLGGVAAQLVELAAGGNLTATGAAGLAAGFAYDRWVKGGRFLPRVLGRWGRK